MTVCIAVASDHGEIFAVCDQMLSSAVMSADRTAFKIRQLTDRWHMMFATSGDAGIVDPLTSKLRERCSAISANTLDQIAEACAGGFSAQLREQISRTILLRYNLTLDQFIRNGLQYFGPALFADLKEQIEQSAIGVELLVFGFDNEGEPHIFTVTDPGEVQHRDVTRKWAIGSGAWTAIGVLMRDPMLIHGEREEIVYSVCEAKFLAESALGVGKNTQLLILRKSGDTRLYTGTDLSSVRAVWEKLGRPTIPIEAIETIKRVIVAK